MPPYNLQFLLKVAEIVFGNIISLGRKHEAAAVSALALAERYVDIEGEPGGRQSLKLRQVLFRSYASGKLGSGGIARVARSRTVVPQL